MRKHRLIAVLAIGFIIAVGLVATATASTKKASVALRTTSLGKVLVAANGRTLYLFTADKGTTSACYGKCAAVWPPLIADKPSVGPGLNASMIGTTKRKDGALQVTYGGHPLYFFAKDKKAGDVKGQGIVHFGGAWYAVSAAGRKLASASPSNAHGASSRAKPVSVQVFAPGKGDNAGANGAGWFVDMAIDFHGKDLQQAGFSGLQLTGPAGHNNVPPFPGTFSPGQDDRLPGLVVLVSTTNDSLPGFSGPGTNLANLFNITGVTNRDSKETELWDSWIVGAPIAGQNVNATLTVAVVDDLNHDGIYNDAPGVVPDLNHDGRIDAKDLELMGVASNIVTVPFRIDGDPAQP